MGSRMTMDLISILFVVPLIWNSKYPTAVHGSQGQNLIQNNSTNLLFQEETLDLVISPAETLVWGSGLRPHEIILPARYFYIQLKGKGGRNLRRNEVEKDELRVRIDCAGDRQVWTQVLDTGGDEPTFIVRYKTLQSCHNDFRIIFTYSHIHLANSPIVFNVPVLPDVCNCPQLEAQEWLRNVGCPSHYVQLAHDLRSFPIGSVDFGQTLERILRKFHRPTSHSFCHYAIIKNTIYRRCYGEHTGFHIFPDAILLFLTRRMWMDDVEFVMNLGDWPLVNKERSKGDELLPIFSWCKTNNSLDILVPTYELTEASLEAMGRVSVDMLTVQGTVGVSWEDKKSQLFWRGRDSREERLELINIGRTHPNFFNVSLTNFFFFKDRETEFGPKEPQVSFFTFFDYKYQLNIDGTVAAYRFPFLLGGDAVVLKVDSPYFEHFYRELSPFKHYIPVKANLSDLVEKLQWAMENDKEARLISENGLKYAQQNLMPLDVFCYHATAYTEWAQRLSNPVLIRPGMEVVKQAKVSHGRICDCPGHEAKGHETTRERQERERGKLEL